MFAPDLQVSLGEFPPGSPEAVAGLGLRTAAQSDAVVAALCSYLRLPVQHLLMPADDQLHGKTDRFVVKTLVKTVVKTVGKIVVKIVVTTDRLGVTALVLGLWSLGISLCHLTVERFAVKCEQVASLLILQQLQGVNRGQLHGA